MNIKKTLADFIIRNTSFVQKWGNGYWYQMGMFRGQQQNYLKDFTEIPELNAVINIRATMMAKGRKELLSNKTGEPVMGYEHIVKVLREPNWYQSAKEFWRQSEIYRCIYGEEFIYFVTPVGMPNSYKAMFSLDPSKVDIDYNKAGIPFSELSNEGVKYFYKADNGQRVELIKENVLHLNDNRVATTDYLRGTSKLEALAKPLENIRLAYAKRRISLMVPVGVFSNNNTDEAGAIPMDQKEKESASKAFELHGAKPIFTNLRVNYNQLNVNPVQMGLFEETREDLLRVCDAFGIDSTLLSTLKGATFDNKDAGAKNTYQNTIIPAAEEKTEALNKRFDGKTWQVVESWNHLHVFSEDIKERASSLQMISGSLISLVQAQLITAEQAQQELTKFNI